MKAILILFVLSLSLPQTSWAAQNEETSAGTYCTASAKYEAKKIPQDYSVYGASQKKSAEGKPAATKAE